ncbi:hypothetical protein [Streptomyces sp. URMC 129]|uniref:hypothetical protein n=1 Tax=Streptomyces sp. URMC 129 TaxID=3423407 RepID=UPI003F1C5063
MSGAGTLHACSVDGDVGTADLRVSRRQGELTYRHGHWRLRGTGEARFRPARDRRVFRSGEPVLVAPGRAALSVTEPGGRLVLAALGQACSDGAPGEVGHRPAGTGFPHPPSCNRLGRNVLTGLFGSGSLTPEDLVLLDAGPDR